MLNFKKKLIMGSPFKMTPKQEGFIKAMRKAGKTEAANKIEAGIKKNDKESVDGAMLMNKDYALKMGGYGDKTSEKPAPGQSVTNWFKQRRDQKASTEPTPSNPKVKKHFEKGKGKGAALKKTDTTEDINRPVKDPQPGTEAYAKQERKKGKTANKQFSPVTGEPIDPNTYKERREQAQAKQSDQRRYLMGSGDYSNTYVDTRSGKRYRVGKGPKYQS